jgi:hypothetical protein
MTAVAAMLGGAAIARPPVVAQSAEQPAFVCPMHPDVLASVPGACPRCGMALVRAAVEARDYAVEMETAPRAPRAGAPVRLRFTVRHPGDGGAVREFAVVHDKPYHLFVISQDLEEYQHVHPRPQADGSLTVEVTLGRPGYYRVYSDFLPVGGTPQVIPGALVTADAAADLASSTARLVPDLTLERRQDQVLATLDLPRAGLVAGREEKVGLHVRDGKTGTPVRDLEPYLGAYGHALVMSEDTLHYVHAHPVESLVPGAATAGGPDLTFKALLPKPGRYRIWIQVRRAGVVSTLPFTVNVASPADSGAAG